eukprot:CAMPEP_0171248478 /NCGR_PEP_ID=MMETSP0790-20130122/49043_1 /TAXON_ID=2925 /ORGANISM="Alexandrium catenella, Strain OF101" /LENGTH=41 /DNA_ID= /DNA_START= /DNA_END= /DNA_ORIENTATION=
MRGLRCDFSTGPSLAEALTGATKGEKGAPGWLPSPGASIAA